MPVLQGLPENARGLALGIVGAAIVIGGVLRLVFAEKRTLGFITLTILAWLRLGARDLGAEFQMGTVRYGCDGVDSLPPVRQWPALCRRR